MKFIHLSDLHLGKRVNEFSMIGDQTYILGEILRIVDREAPDAVLIAGDVYDKPVPSAEAVSLFDDFLTSLSKKELQVFVISGNHDSSERLAFGSRLIGKSGIHLSPVWNGKVGPHVLRDEFGEVNVYMLPFIKPVQVRHFFSDEEIKTYTDALQVAIREMHMQPEGRNVLMTHQFVTGAERSESEEISVGGADNVDASVFDGWDYVALGHLHGPQNAGSERIRYCGTPLKYSFSEIRQEKSVTVVELKEKGSLTVRCVPLVPLRDMAEIRGTYEELMRKSFYENTTYENDYMHIILTDEEDVVEGAAKLRTVYRNFMKLDYDNKRTRHTEAITGTADAETKTPLELFSELYEKQNGAPMSEEQEAFVTGLIEKVWEEAE